MPAPLALPLTTTFPCRAAPGARATPHPVVVGADWRAVTGHDEELERIAAALGGGASCITELPAVLPLFARWWRRATRVDGLVVRSQDRGRSWHVVDGPGPCCPTHGFRDPRLAGAHAREVRHVAGADRHRRELRHLVAGLGAVADPPAPPGPAGLDPGLVADGWACGLAPDAVGALVAALGGAGVGPPLEVLLAAMQHGTDLGWVHRTVQAAGADPAGATEGDAAGATEGDAAAAAALAAWLAWTPTPLDAEDPDARGRWLATGARRADIEACSQAGYRAEDAMAVAHGWGLSVPGAAQVLARWVGMGGRPEPGELVALREAGLAFAPTPPSAQAVARLAALLHLGSLDQRGTTALALAICREGTVLGAARRWGKGAHGRRSA